MSVIKFAKFSQFAKTPTKATRYAAGYDLYSAYDYVIASGDRELILTDIKIQMPHGCYGRVASKSGLALNYGIHVGAGVVDRDYTGNVGVLLFNFGKESYAVAKGFPVAQLICERYEHCSIVEEDLRHLTQRGASGFGFEMLV